MPVALVCELDLDQPYLPTGSQLHGLFFSMLGRIDPDLAETIHGAPERPFTLSPLLDEQGRPLADHRRHRRAHNDLGSHGPSAPTTLYWRITLLNDRHAAALAQGVSRTNPRLDGLMLGPVAVALRRLFLDTAAHHLAGYMSYDELLTAGSSLPAKGVQFHFLTPTTIRARQMNLPIPEPAALFSGYARRWNANAPRAVPEEVIAAIQEATPAPLRLSRHRIQTAVHPLAQAHQIGFVGTASFEFSRTNPAVQAWLTTLARFAFYAGSGYKATMGMGLTVPSLAINI